MEDLLKGLAKLVGLVCIIGLVVGVISWIAFGNNNDSDYYEDNSGSNISFKGAQTGYTGECKKCDCSYYDRSADGICECGHYKTDHTWHN